MIKCSKTEEYNNTKQTSLNINHIIKINDKID